MNFIHIIQKLAKFCKMKRMNKSFFSYIIRVLISGFVCKCFFFCFQFSSFMQKMNILNTHSNQYSSINIQIIWHMRRLKGLCCECYRQSNWIRAVLQYLVPENEISLWITHFLGQICFNWIFEYWLQMYIGMVRCFHLTVHSVGSKFTAL